MLLRSLKADFLKISKKGIWLLVIGAPLGVVLMMALNWGLRYNYLTHQNQGHLWQSLLGDIGAFVPISLFLGCTLVSSLVSNVEHQTSAWKQLLALPISRKRVFLSKFLLCTLLLLLSCFTLSIGSLILGLVLGFGTAIPVGQVAILGLFPYLSALPLLSLQLWLSVVYQNQAIPVTLGVTVSLVSIGAGQLPEWFILNWPSLSLNSEQKVPFIIAGIVTALIVLFISRQHFNRKDIA
ncbi:hypothetical protein J2Z32_003223 [Paenibacillus turicensis]|uniref:Permease n=1 Tax=Paenibacillus turicensis TaxID=160487 RepID=A0ABS4FVF6_9BACL|nr:ABC transporter permease [Paenibacillus turicensis]MBP1906561.1 hypothetical protein [Paenibacillus turicensis]